MQYFTAQSNIWEWSMRRYLAQVSFYIDCIVTNILACYMISQTIHKCTDSPINTCWNVHLDNTHKTFYKLLTNFQLTSFKLFTSFLRATFEFVTKFLRASNEHLMNILWASYELLTKLLWCSNEHLANLLLPWYKLLTHFLCTSFEFLTNYFKFLIDNFQISCKHLTSSLQASYELLLE